LQITTTAGGVSDSGSGSLTITGNTTISATATDITLNNTNNNFSVLSISTARNAVIVDQNALDLGNTTVTGTLNVTTGAALTDSGSLLVSGTSTLTAGAQDITLDNVNNDFATLSIASARNVIVVDKICTVPRQPRHPIC